MSLRSPRFVAIAAAGLAVAIAAVYARALPGPFVFDDQSAIVANETLRALHPLGRVLAQPPDLTISGRPLVSLSLALNYALSGLDPRPYRATNALVHWACALLLFGVVRRTLRSPRLDRRFGARADGLALATAFLFALHPLASEAVCYVTARTESLMALFYLATLYLAIRARESARPWGWVAARGRVLRAGHGEQGGHGERAARGRAARRDLLGQGRGARARASDSRPGAGSPRRGRCSRRSCSRRRARTRPASSTG